MLRFLILIGGDSFDDDHGDNLPGHSDYLFWFLLCACACCAVITRYGYSCRSYRSTVVASPAQACRYVRLCENTFERLPRAKSPAQHQTCAFSVIYHRSTPPCRRHRRLADGKGRRPRLSTLRLAWRASERFAKLASTNPPTARPGLTHS